MPSKEKAVLPEIYQLKITLLGTDPPIWRRLLVPAEFTLAQLHHVLQVAMGWSDDHMHGFSVGKRRIGPINPEGQFMDDLEEEDERTVTVSDVLAKVGSKVTYTYDFGDDWDHVMVLEKRLPFDPNLTYPVCTDGQLACPPEDCGGVYGFYDLVEARADPNHSRHQEMFDWLEGDFDPQAFSVDNVNRKLTLVRRRGKARKS